MFFNKESVGLVVAAAVVTQSAAAAVVASSQLDSTTAVVNLNNHTGAPQYLASGNLYGIPNAVDQIQSKWFTGINWNYNRAGGGQIPAPGRGWVYGVNEFHNRFTTALHNYITTRKAGGTFILLLSDLWGSDGSLNSSQPFPGDNGDWASYDSYLDHVIKNIRSNQMEDGLVVDLWNEPDLVLSGKQIFWLRSQDQYLQMWGRGWYKFREEFGKTVLLSGPSTAGEPLADYSWWQNFSSFIAANDSIPDQYVWHMEGGGGDLLSALGGLTALQKEYGLPGRPININEYATYPEQVPSGLAWWIGQLERINAHGLLGQWLSGYQLHDYLSTFLGKPNAETPEYNPKNNDYWPTGQWQMFHFYAKNMTGTRVGTLPSADLKLDTYATLSTTGIVRVLAGTRITTGNWTVQVNDLSSIGLPTSGTLRVHQYAFPVGPNVHFSEVDAPTDLGYTTYTYSGNSVKFPVVQTDNTTAYAYAFASKQNTQVVF